MVAPNASPAAAASFSAILDEKLNTSTALQTGSSAQHHHHHPHHEAEEFLQLLDAALPASVDNEEVAAHAMKSAGNEQSSNLVSVITYHSITWILELFASVLTVRTCV